MESKTKLNQKREKGITLVALIITIIVLVILATVSINVVYNSRIVEYAINGTTSYVKEGINENKVLEGTESLIDSAIDNIKKINAGNISSIEPTSPEPTGLTKEELVKDEMVGKYVDYKSQGTNYIVEGAYSGTDSNQTFLKNDNMKWRIWGVEENKLLLISETQAGNIQLKGADGYNNAVKILNDACSTAFGNSSYGSVIKVRSINQDDIDKVTNMTEESQREAVYSGYGTTATVTTSIKNWPNIYGQETGKTEGGSLDRNDQSDWITGITNSSFTGKYTYYAYNITNYATQTIYDVLLTNMSTNSISATDNHPRYWSASRCIRIYDTGAIFGVFNVTNGTVGVLDLYGTDGSMYGLSDAVCPMVEVNLDLVSIGATGLGTNIAPYSMVLK